MDTGIEQWDYIYSLNFLVYEHYPVNLNRAFPETLRNVWNLITKSGLIRNLCALSHCTKAYNIYHWEHYILHTKFIHLRYPK